VKGFAVRATFESECSRSYGNAAAQGGQQRFGFRLVLASLAVSDTSARNLPYSDPEQTRGDAKQLDRLARSGELSELNR
jgi:hypothetical protein